MPDGRGRATGTTRGAAHGELWVGACLLGFRARRERAAAELPEGARRQGAVRRAVELQDVVLRRGAEHGAGRRASVAVAEVAAGDGGRRGAGVAGGLGGEVAAGSGTAHGVSPA